MLYFTRLAKVFRFGGIYNEIFAATVQSPLVKEFFFF